ncbi:hypothetical protein [Comamonas sp. MYb396]|uniref:hypothetical protein n=1 Tax=Comamonas sp. MYb396 TaxID=2745302 RepID=UPI0030B1AE11
MVRPARCGRRGVAEQVRPPRCGRLAAGSKAPASAARGPILPRATHHQQGGSRHTGRGPEHRRQVPCIPPLPRLPADARALAALIYGSLAEAAFWIADGADGAEGVDGAARLEQSAAGLDLLLRGLLVQPQRG